MEKKIQENRIKALLFEMDNSNMFCADCNRPDTSFISVNNGIILCSQCAEIHKQLGNSISYIKEVSEKWDDYLISYIRCGSNERFTKFCKSYKIDKLDILQKYKTRAAEYYRGIIRSEVMGYDPPDNINLKTAAEVLENIENNYPEFDNYTFVKHVDMESLERNIKKQKEETGEDTFFGKVSKMFGDGVNYAKEKYSENKDTVIETGGNIFQGIKNWFGGNEEENKNNLEEEE